LYCKRGVLEGTAQELFTQNPGNDLHGNEVLLSIVTV
jgi:hypothetical protein